jgi:selenocysteine lyase/cysteine desulfurase
VRAPLEGVDFLVASSYKWLLGSHGLGVVYASDELIDRLRPATAGWYGVREIFAPDRFERFAYKEGAARFAAGMPNFPAIYAARAGLRCLLEAGVERVEKELRPLVGSLREGLADLGLELLTLPEPEFASGIVSFRHNDPEALGAALGREGIVVWAGDGRVRASIHLYNSTSDVSHFLAVMKSLRGGQEHRP